MRLSGRMREERNHLSTSRRIAAPVLCLLLVLLAIPAPSASDSAALPSKEGAASSPRQGVSSLVDTYERTIEIPAGSRFFLSLSPDGKIAPMPVPSPEAGMPPEVLSAVERAPRWLRGDLLDKFRELASLDLHTNSMAISDFDGDGDLDFFSTPSWQGNGTLLHYYENVGSEWVPLFTDAGRLQRDWDLNSTPLMPVAGDIDGDGDADILIGDLPGNLWVLINPGEISNSAWAEADAGVGVSGRAAPALGDMDGDGDLDIVVGDGNGRLHYFENTGNRTSWRFQRTSNSVLFAPLVVPGAASPALADLDGDSDLDLAVGAGTGGIQYFRNVGTTALPAWAPSDPVMFAGIQVEGAAMPSLADFNGDNRTDLYLGQGGACMEYLNTGTSTDPAWETWPFYQYIPEMGYYDPHRYLRCLQWEAGNIRGYTSALLQIEDRCVDELAFTIAHSAVEVLRASGPELYVENARSVYANDAHLDYARVVDCAGYSTVRYIVNESGAAVEVELPRDIYYWYIVHPKITDELPLYIDPDEPSGSASATAPPPEGKFWRDYIFFNADPEYPPDPPTDLNGDGAPDFHYPKTIRPPRLADMLSGIKYLWNCSTYSSPPGFDDAGVNNSRPLDYGDHAIERLSNWVAKTVPLNERESGDGERPIQPVRIFHHHNGNCGELQDLTVAAARAALIPAAGVSLLGEDHVWIEFYERGWHQWDNYWSDSGSVVDNFMNYWVGWGKRGGSGIFKWDGDDRCFEVTARYIPPESQSQVTVNVRDASGYPVDGARVFMMSHWLAEQATPVEGVSFPFPAIWNYTDTEGRATFTLAANNFTINVLSKLGAGLHNKTYIGEGQSYTFELTLPGRLPWPEPLGEPGPEGGVGLEVGLELSVLAGKQRPPNPEVGTTSVQPVDTGLSVDLFICSESAFELYLSGLSFVTEQSLSGVRELSHRWSLSGSRKWYLVLSSEDALETIKTGALRLSLSAVPEPPQVTIDYPVEGGTYDSSRPLSLSGGLRAGAAPLSLRLALDQEPPLNITSGADPQNRSWRWEADLSVHGPGWHSISVEVEDALGRTNRTGVDVELDRDAPRVRFLSPWMGEVIEMGEPVELRGRAEDDLRVCALLLSVDGRPPVELTSSLNGSLWSLSLPPESLAGGSHVARVTALDAVGKAGADEVGFEVHDSVPPEIAIIEPAELEEFELGASVVVRGKATDASGVGSLTLEVGGLELDLLSSLAGGLWCSTWSSSTVTEPGRVVFTVSAKDGAGNSASASRTILLVDRGAPRVCITAPESGAVFAVGEVIRVEGVASDHQGVARLELRAGELGWRSIRGSLRGDTFRYSLDTADLPEGVCNITVRAADPSGNIGESIVRIYLEGPAKFRPAPQSARRLLPGGGAATLILALALASILRLAGGLGREGGP